MRHAQTREALRRLGFDVVASSPEEFARWIRAESEKWPPGGARERCHCGLNFREAIQSYRVAPGFSS
jgi:hypothetical protein